MLQKWFIFEIIKVDNSNERMMFSFKTEEVLLTYVAHWWSADGARLAYLTINNSATPVMEIPHFLGGLYPSNVAFPYPKVKVCSNSSGAN